MIDVAVHIVCYLADDVEHMHSALRIHGAALHRDKHKVGKTGGQGDQRVARPGKIDDDMVCLAALSPQVGTQIGEGHTGHDSYAVDRAGQPVPLGCERQRIAIEDDDLSARLRKLHGQKQCHRRLAGSPLGIRD